MCKVVGPCECVESIYLTTERGDRKSRYGYSVGLEGLIEISLFCTVNCFWGYELPVARWRWRGNERYETAMARIEKEIF